jgi:hypothetical protein
MDAKKATPAPVVPKPKVVIEMSYEEAKTFFWSFSPTNQVERDLEHEISKALDEFTAEEKQNA